MRKTNCLFCASYGVPAYSYSDTSVGVKIENISENLSDDNYELVAGKLFSDPLCTKLNKRISRRKINVGSRKIVFRSVMHKTE